MYSPRLVAETKQCLQNALHGSQICTSALTCGWSTKVRK